METEVRCPSGLEGTIRPLKVRDEALFTDGKVQRSGRLIEEMCRRCWVSLKSPGPYNFKDGKVDWQQVLQGDLFWIFIQIRRISYGDGYDVTVPCPSCRGNFEESIDLGQIPPQMLPAESFDSLKNGTPLEARTTDGRRVTYRLLTAADDKHIRSLSEVNNLPIRYAALVRRLLSVDGLPEGRQAAMIGFVQELTAGDADFLLEQIERADCGADVDILAVCRHCGHEQAILLPLEASFFRRRAQTAENRRLELLKRRSATANEGTTPNG